MTVFDLVFYEKPVYFIILHEFYDILNFLSMILIEFQEHLKNTLILCGFDPYSPLYSKILDFNLKFVSFEKF